MARGVTRYTAGRDVEIIEVNFPPGLKWKGKEASKALKILQKKILFFRLGFEKANVNLKEVFGRTNVEN